MKSVNGKILAFVKSLSSHPSQVSVKVLEDLDVVEIFVNKGELKKIASQEDLILEFCFSEGFTSQCVLTFNAFHEQPID